MVAGLYVSFNVRERSVSSMIIDLILNLNANSQSKRSLLYNVHIWMYNMIGIERFLALPWCIKLSFQVSFYEYSMICDANATRFHLNLIDASC